MANLRAPRERKAVPLSGPAVVRSGRKREGVHPAVVDACFHGKPAAVVAVPPPGAIVAAPVTVPAA